MFMFNAPLVEICESNRANDALLEAMEAGGKITLLRYDCMGHCLTCRDEAYMLLDGEMISAPTLKSLLEQLDLLLRT
jgi:uncharacterized protein YuzB (UPF0349 family)